jgi:hypothetical protein
MRVLTVGGIVASLIWLVAAVIYGANFDRSLFPALFPDVPNLSDQTQLYYIVLKDMLIWVETAHCSNGANVDLDISHHPIPHAAATRLMVCGSAEELVPWTQAAIDSGARDADLARLSLQIVNLNRFKAISGVLPTVVIGFIALAPLLMIGMIALIRNQMRRGSA